MLCCLCPALGAPPPNTSWTQVGAVERFDHFKIKRRAIRITIPLGRTEQQVRATLERATRDLAKRTRASAVMVWAYRPGDQVKATYTVGLAVLAPNGKWEDAGEDAPKKLTIDLPKDGVYFRPAAKTTLGKGDECRFSESAKISRKRDAWLKSDIIAEAPKGAGGIVLEHYEKAITADFLFVRFRVLVRVDGRPIEGWVDGEVLTRK